MEENKTRVGQIVRVKDNVPHFLWSQAPGSGAYWGLPTTHTATRVITQDDCIRIRFYNGEWNEVDRDAPPKDPKAKPDETGTLPLF